MNIRTSIGKSGTAAVEFALISPIFITLLMGTVDYGLEIYYDAQLHGAVRAGAQYATGTGEAANYTGITAAIQGNSSLAGLVVPTPVSSCLCANGGTVACTGGTCTDGSKVGTYLTVSATYTYTSFLTFFSSAPRTLSASVTVRTS